MPRKGHYIFRAKFLTPFKLRMNYEHDNLHAFLGCIVLRSILQPVYFQLSCTKIIANICTS